MTARREDLTEALNASWALELFPDRAPVTLGLVGGALLFFVRDTSSGVPATLPRELASIRHLAIDAARGLLHPFAWWGLE